MPNVSTLYKKLHARFTEVFGKPDTSLGKSDHWSLSPDSDLARINLLVHKSDDTADVWVFDPHSRDDGVKQITVAREEQINEIIELIHERVKEAKQPPQAT